MFKFLFKSKFLGFVEAPVGVFSYIFKTNIFAFNVKAMLAFNVKAMLAYKKYQGKRE